jgi:phosphohistidine swiveling domain-containing protein
MARAMVLSKDVLFIAGPTANGEDEALFDDASHPALLMAVDIETGATISHAAIVSRELGIPAAVSVADATRRIRDGSIITVDGNTGTVSLE